MTYNPLTYSNYKKQNVNIYSDNNYNFFDKNFNILLGNKIIIKDKLHGKFIKNYILDIYAYISHVLILKDRNNQLKRKIIAVNNNNVFILDDDDIYSTLHFDRIYFKDKVFRAILKNKKNEIIQKIKETFEIHKEEIVFNKFNNNYVYLSNKKTKYKEIYISNYNFNKYSKSCSNKEVFYNFKNQKTQIAFSKIYPTKKGDSNLFINNKFKNLKNLVLLLKYYNCNHIIEKIKSFIYLNPIPKFNLGQICKSFATSVVKYNEDTLQDDLLLHETKIDVIIKDIYLKIENKNIIKSIKNFRKKYEKLNNDYSTNYFYELKQPYTIFYLVIPIYNFNQKYPFILNEYDLKEHKDKWAIDTSKTLCNKNCHHLNSYIYNLDKFFTKSPTAYLNNYGNFNKEDINWYHINVCKKQNCDICEDLEKLKNLYDQNNSHELYKLENIEYNKFTFDSLIYYKQNIKWKKI